MHLLPFPCSLPLLSLRCRLARYSVPLLTLYGRQEAEREEIYLREQELALSPLGLLMPKAKVYQLRPSVLTVHSTQTPLTVRLLQPAACCYCSRISGWHLRKALCCCNLWIVA